MWVREMGGADARSPPLWRCRFFTLRPSQRGLVLLGVPGPVWGRLPGHLAVSGLGFVGCCRTPRTLRGGICFGGRGAGGLRRPGGPGGSDRPGGEAAHPPACLSVPLCWDGRWEAGWLSMGYDGAMPSDDDSQVIFTEYKPATFRIRKHVYYPPLPKFTPEQIKRAQDTLMRPYGQLLCGFYAR